MAMAMAMAMAANINIKKKQVTVRLDSTLHKALKLYLVRREQTFQAWVEEQAKRAVKT